jgi:hypothetical protein
MFWLQGETEHSCSKSYGAMTRFELGQISTRYALDPSVRFCVGSDERFSELSTIMYDLSEDAPDKLLYSTLEHTCRTALAIARKA